MITNEPAIKVAMPLGMCQIWHSKLSMKIASLCCFWCLCTNRLFSEQLQMVSLGSFQ
jgi:hypothetical protein